MLIASCSCSFETLIVCQSRLFKCERFVIKLLLKAGMDDRLVFVLLLERAHPVAWGLVEHILSLVQAHKLVEFLPVSKVG